MYWIETMKSVMTKRLKTTGLAVSAAALLGCAPSSDPVYTQFYREAGALADTGSFGDANLNNRLVMTGERQYTIDLANRFAAEVNSTVNFAFNSSKLDAQAQAILRQQAGWIRQFPEIRFRVYGHTDAVGSNRYNRTLGLRRANAAVAYLTSQGISRRRLEAVASFGETQPLIVTQGRERKNRRTVTEVSGFVKRHPTVLDGKYAQIIYRDYVASAIPPSELTGTALGNVAE
ncbi:OmpA family protein [Sulfitobacter mediterraneus]|uniref:OmpA family protein n=1 Tax=Sulfitobacter mediterraneus TaxID=83219 RepID=UPI001939B6F3|nr:OmpA family protein [Sulfitobacter mediterraneus]MBM1557792.1 OmpA family protein [Sulfitobacter mediterraneus]MBM1568833.1 OmpA family protein [Sulfitobacter mediterraneus]MBM1572965.1 OmpA family protein [Sulfitobacter mediterraneus]MBM1576166.1 OmpA family protein [Sulfitobacter mediterraneus]MBM1580750.1 OmpA family protein [Sulfitobacter mediterraneus]